MTDQMPSRFNLLKQIMFRFMCKTAADIKLHQTLEFQANEEKREKESISAETKLLFWH